VKLIVGLGNPGLKYVNTRHNLGLVVASELARQLDVRLSHFTMHAEWGRGYISNEAFIIARPLTYMNCSGQAVAALSRYFKLTSEQILVIVDDFNLPIGTLRFRSRGSAGGHNGLKSVIEKIGSQSFHRLRIGINQPPPFMEVTDYVLGRFREEEEVVIQATIAKAVSAAKCWLEQGISRAMAGYN